jgi:hypothetical protein
MYVGLYFPPGSQEIQDYLDNLESENPDRDILNWFYSTPVRVQPELMELPNGDFVAKPPQSSFWHVLLTEEQYLQRVADNKPCLDFETAPGEYKKDGAPRHVFGPNGMERLPRHKRPEVE